MRQSPILHVGIGVPETIFEHPEAPASASYVKHTKSKFWVVKSYGSYGVATNTSGGLISRNGDDPIQPLFFCG